MKQNVLKLLLSLIGISAVFSSAYCSDREKDYDKEPNFSHLSNSNNLYYIDKKSDISFKITKGMFLVLKETVVEDTIYKAPFSVNQDTIHIMSSKKIPLFKVKSDAIFIALSDLKPYIKKGDKLYARVYQVGQSILFIGGGWVNDLKDGNWDLFDNGVFSKLIYKEGVIVDIR